MYFEITDTKDRGFIMNDFQKQRDDTLSVLPSWVNFFLDTLMTCFIAPEIETGNFFDTRRWPEQI